MALVTQIANIVNDSVKDALGKSVSPTELDSSDIVSLGKTISQYDAWEPFYKSLTNRIVRTIYFIRVYSAKSRSILRDEHEFGAFVQKVYYEMPDASDNPTWEIPDGNGDYKQKSPYDVENTVAVSSLIFGGKGTWTIEIVRPLPQIKSAFLSEADMLNFIDGIYLAVENSFKLQEERLVALAANTAMADVIKSGRARNLLAEYNTNHSGATISSVAAALESADFLKYASMEINRTIKNMAKMSTAFNSAGYTTFTEKDKLVVEMNAQFASASEMYLQADTFHDELVKLPNYEEVPFWQSSGANFDFADCSKINVTNSALIGSDPGDTGNVEQGGIICFLHDVENVAAYFGARRTWELWNPRSEVMIHGEKADKGFSVDNHANSVVFYIAVA